MRKRRGEERRDKKEQEEEKKGKGLTRGEEVQKIEGRGK